MFRIKNIFLCILCSSAMLFAQESGKLDRTKPPKTEKPKDIYFPKFEETVLSNGLKLIVIENHNQPTLFVSVTVRGGSYFDKQKPGLSSLVSELMTKRTTSRNAAQIAQEVDYLGAELSSNSSWDANRINIKLLKKNMEKGLDIFSDVLINPSFSDEELSREIKQRLAELKHSKSEPNYLAETRFLKVLYENLPYSNTVSGDEESLSGITVEDLKSFYGKYFLPNNSYCVVVGDITLKEISGLLDSKLSNWKSAEKAENKYEKFTINNKRRIVIVDKKEAIQSSIRIGSIAIDRKDPDFFIASVLNTYLGGYFRSQLNLNLREKNSFTYGASSGFESRILPGPFLVRTEVASEVTAAAVKEILNEIEALQKKDIDDDRFNEVKNFIIGSFPIGIQTSSQLGAAYSVIELYGLPNDYYANYVANIQKVTKSDIRKVAKKFLDLSKLTIVISGDSKSTKESLKVFGNVEVVDADGKPVK